MRAARAFMALAVLAQAGSGPKPKVAVQKATPPKSALFRVEIAAAELMRKTTGSMLYDPAYEGPTILSWKCAHDLKLGNGIGDLFRPSHNDQLAVKRRSIDLDRYPGLKALMPVGPPAYLMGRGSGKPVLDLFVIRPAKPFHMTGIDAAGNRRSSPMREICIVANTRVLFLHDSLAGPDFLRRFNAGISTVGFSRGVLWDQHRVNLHQSVPRNEHILAPSPSEPKRAPGRGP